MPSNVGSNGSVPGSGNASLNAIGSVYAKTTGKSVTSLLSRTGKKKKKGKVYTATKMKKT